MSNLNAAIQDLKAELDKFANNVEELKYSIDLEGSIIEERYVAYLRTFESSLRNLIIQPPPTGDLRSGSQGTEIWSCPRCSVRVVR